MFWKCGHCFYYLYTIIVPILAPGAPGIVFLVAGTSYLQAFAYAVSFAHNALLKHLCFRDPPAYPSRLSPTVLPCFLNALSSWCLWRASCPLVQAIPVLDPHFSRGHTFFLWFSYSTTVHISPWFQIPRGHWVPRPGPLPPQSYEATGPILQGQRTVAKRGKWLGLIPSSAIPTSVSLGK